MTPAKQGSRAQVPESSRTDTYQTIISSVTLLLTFAQMQPCLACGHGDVWQAWRNVVWLSSPRHVRCTLKFEACEACAISHFAIHGVWPEGRGCCPSSCEQLGPVRFPFVRGLSRHLGLLNLALPASNFERCALQKPTQNTLFEVENAASVGFPDMQKYLDLQRIA